MSAMLSCTCKADGRQSTQTREANNFNGIEVGQGIRTNVSIGDEERVEVVAPDDVIDLLTTEVSKGKLDIKWKKGSSIKSTRHAVVNVTAKSLNSIVANSGASVDCADTIVSSSFYLSSTSGAKVKVVVRAENFDGKCSSGAKIEVGGSAQNVGLNASSGARFEADSLVASNGEAHSSSGALVNINATNTLKAEASSGGRIRYIGSPSMSDVSSSSGGSISRMK